jgi:hypothetical protein
MFKCNLCGKEFINKAGLGGHLATVHGMRRDKEPPLRTMVKESFAQLEHRLRSVEGRVGGLERVRLQQPLGPGTPPIEDLFEAIMDYLKRPQVCHRPRYEDGVCIVEQTEPSPVERLKKLLG